MVLHHPHQELCAYIEAVKEVILRLLVLHEQLKILKHLQEKKKTGRSGTQTTQHWAGLSCMKAGLPGSH